MNKKLIGALGAVAVLGATGFVAVTGGQFFAGAASAPKVIDPIYGDYHHIYMFSDGRTRVWHVSTKDSGPITDKSGKVLTSTVDKTHPDCLNVFVAAVPGKDQEISWTTASADPVSVGSASESLRVLACRNPVPEYEAADMN